MDLPFTTRQFFEVFAAYNEAVWPAQVVLYGLALTAVAALFTVGPAASRIAAGALACLWAWMGAVYHIGFFAAINPAAWLFGALFLLEALILAGTGAIRGGLGFRRRGGARGWTGAALVVYALAAYPATGYALGHRYPEAPTFGLPCPATIFTIGLLEFADETPKAVWVVPLLWCAIGSVAAFQLGVIEDLALLAAGAVAGVRVFSRSEKTL